MLEYFLNKEEFEKCSVLKELMKIDFIGSDNIQYQLNIKLEEYIKTNNTNDYEGFNRKQI